MHMHVSQSEEFLQAIGVLWTSSQQIDVNSKAETFLDETELRTHLQHLQACIR